MTRRVETTLSVTGGPTPEEIAAVLAVLAAAGGAAPAPGRPTRVWADPARQVGADVRPTSGGWSRSALPR